MRPLKNNPSACPASRWQLLKFGLNNLHLEEFIGKANRDKQAILLDVRTRSEFLSGHLPGAQNLDYLSDSFVDELLNLPKENSYFIYCRSCRRSTRVCINLVNSGYPHVFNLQGGLNAYPELLTKVIGFE